MNDMVVMYGLPPKEERVPVMPPIVPMPFPIPSQLVVCVTCKRHIVVGTQCPFCYAESRTPATAEELAKLEEICVQAKATIKAAADEAIARIEGVLGTIRLARGVPR